jgi:hypothetical protein
MDKFFSKERCSIFVLGVLCILGVLLFTGFQTRTVPRGEVGRYQMQAASFSGGHCKIFAIDTTTGIVKTAYDSMSRVDNRSKKFKDY